MSTRNRAPGWPGSRDILNRRTAVETAEPMAVDVEKDELIFFPLLYWPVVEGEALPSAKAAASICNRYLATGGTILFDTRDAGSKHAHLRARRREAQLRVSPPGSRSRRWCRCRPITC